MKEDMIILKIFLIITIIIFYKTIYDIGHIVILSLGLCFIYCHLLCFQLNVNL